MVKENFKIYFNNFFKYFSRVFIKSAIAPSPHFIT